ncbi:Transposase, Tc1-like [Penicillium camemberti]|uniref:Transposase, Tc1-like n=1 Tax=Penicillium camemberti (strain FM 013) TaxID=1429867 RepID=A0A0G4PEG6_PENC3|nr:Transposase, Tc1-like [Penicillium camemberti]
MGHDIAKRAMVVTCKATGLSTTTISELSGLSKRTINRIYERALANGFDPNARPWNISEAMLADAPRPGRPLKRTEDVQTQVLSKVHTDQDGRAKTCLDIAGEMSLEGHDISSTTVWRILKKAGSQKKTPTETESPV